MLSRPVTSWFSDFVQSIIALRFFVCLFYQLCFACNNVYFSSDLGSYVLTAYTYAYMYLSVFARCLAVMWGRVVNFRLCLSMEMVCPHSALIIHLYCKLPLTPLPLLYIEIIILWDQICLDQSTCIGDLGARNTAMVGAQWNSGWICFHSIYSSILANSGQSDWNCVAFLYSLQSASSSSWGCFPHWDTRLPERNDLPAHFCSAQAISIRSLDLIGLPVPALPWLATTWVPIQRIWEHP